MYYNNVLFVRWNQNASIGLLANSFYSGVICLLNLN